MIQQTSQLPETSEHADAFLTCKGKAIRSELFLTYARIGLFSFGSATSETMMVQLVEKKRWLSVEQYRDAISLAALVPGPFHVNLAGMTGNSIAGSFGGLIAIFAFILPGFVITLFIATILAHEPVSLFLRQNPGVVAGTLVAVAGLLLNVIVRLGKESIPTPALWGLTLLLAIFIEHFHWHFALVVIATGIGFVWLKKRGSIPL